MDQKTGALTWPERWSTERIELVRADLGPLEYARQLLCQARDDTSARFKREWIDTCLEKGLGVPYCESIVDAYYADDELPEGVDSWEELRAGQETIWRLTGKCSVVTGVDLAVRPEDSADETVLFTIMVDEKGNRRVLNITAGRWTGPDILRKIQDVYEAFGGIMVVENNAAQQYIVQFLQENTAIPVIPFTTGRNKAHPEFGVESLAAELAGGKWVIPNMGGVVHKEVGEWVNELLFYDPREHTGDRVMASWFAREGARRFHDGGGDAGKIGVRVF